MLFKVSDTNIKGSIGEYAVVTDLLKRGLQVFTPSFEGCSVDVLAFNSEHRMFKIQVKALTMQKDGMVKLTANARNGRARERVYRTLTEHYNDIDVFAIYVLDQDRILYIPKDHLGSTTSTLSIGFQRGRNCADNFTDFPYYIGADVTGAEEEMKALLNKD